MESCAYLGAHAHLPLVVDHADKLDVPTATQPLARAGVRRLFSHASDKHGKSTTFVGCAAAMSCAPRTFGDMRNLVKSTAETFLLLVDALELIYLDRPHCSPSVQ